LSPRNKAHILRGNAFLFKTQRPLEEPLCSAENPCVKYCHRTSQNICGGPQIPEEKSLPEKGCKSQWEENGVTPGNSPGLHENGAFNRRFLKSKRPKGKLGFLPKMCVFPKVWQNRKMPIALKKGGFPIWKIPSCLIQKGQFLIAKNLVTPYPFPKPK